MDTLQLIRSYQTYNFIKNLKTKINNVESPKINENIKAIENSFSNEEILNDIAVALLNYIWPTSQENSRNFTMKKFIKHVMKFSNTSISIFISSIYYLLNLKDNSKFNNLLQRIQLEIENTKQEQGFINSGNLNERCCNCCGAYISCYRNDTVVCKCRLFLISLVLASKFGQDKNYSNKAWSKISGFSVENINYNERFFLQLVEYRLCINVESYQSFATLISNHIITMKNQKQKMQCKELMNLAKFNTVNANNVHEWKKNLEKKIELIKRIKQLEANKHTRIRNKVTKPTIVANNTTSINNNTEIPQTFVQKNTTVDIRQLLNGSRATNVNISHNIQKLTPTDHQTGLTSESYLMLNTQLKSSDITVKPVNVASISPISPNGLPVANVNATINKSTNVNESINATNIPRQQSIPLSNINLTQLNCQIKKEERSSQKLFNSQTNTKLNQLTLENFTSFIKFYSCINEKLSTSHESIIKATSSYKALNYALNLASAKRVQDAINLLNHLIYGTKEICREILSLAVKGQKKNALIYIYLLTPSEIQFYNNNLKPSSLKSLTPQDVLSVVSILLNCVHKRSNNTHEIKNDLLANIGQQNQVNNTSTQNLLLKFIQNINHSLSQN